MNHSAEQTTRGFNILFIHSSLDDAGLTPTEFRVFAHLSRRAGEGTAFAAAESMAEACKICRDTVWDALKELERRRMITREKRPGQTTLIRLTKPADWLLDPAENKGQPAKSGGPYIPPGGGGNEGPGVAETKGHEGNPLKQSTECNPKREAIPDSLKTPAFLEAWADWERHRKESRKPITPTSRKQQLRKLEAMGVSRAVEAVTNSITQGYQGIFEASNRGQSQPSGASGVSVRKRVFDLEEEIRELEGRLHAFFDREADPEGVARLSAAKLELSKLKSSSHDNR